MAKGSVTLTCRICGDEFVVEKKCYNRGDADQWERWMESNSDHLCSDCYEAEKQRKFDEANAQATAEAAEIGLPELTGSDKQVAWANTIRANWMEVASAHISQVIKRLDHDRVKNNPELTDKINKGIKGMQALVEERLTQTSARIWIDNRNEDIIRVLVVRAETAAVAPPEPPKEVVAQVKEEMTLRPENPITPLVVEIITTNRGVAVSLPEKDETFRELVKELKFRWQNGRWERLTGLKTGSSAERATELGVKLLAAGYPVLVHDDKLRDLILTSDYQPETSRWITRITDTDKYCISWDRNDGDFYTESKRLPGARWDRGQGMVIPKESFREVQDFAEKYSFRFSPGAIEVTALATKAFEASMVADVTPKLKEQLPQPGQTPPVLDIEEGTIDAELRDEN